MTSLSGTIRDITEGSIRRIARTLTEVENGGENATEILDRLFNLKQGFSVGVTGPSAEALFWETGCGCSLTLQTPGSLSEAWAAGDIWEGCQGQPVMLPLFSQLQATAL